jgi:uncharacterized repeat protein (TIGR01451 family)
VDCGPYNICPPEPKIIKFTLDKQVKKLTDTQFTKEVTIKPGDTVKFLITAQNIGEVKTDSMKIIDYLPVEFTLVEGTTIKEFSNFRVNDVVTYEITAKAKETNDICVVNNIEMRYNDKPVNTASAKVCIKKGSVLGNQVLPDTGVIENGFIIVSLLTIATGLSMRILAKEVSVK